MQRRQFLSTVGAGLTAGCLSGARGSTRRGPNFLIILADDMGFSDAGCYGGEIATPHLDALARRGLRFEQAYSTARCWPSRACIMTGYYAQQVNRDAIPGMKGGEGGGQGKRPEWAPMVSQRLRDVGYRTYHSGKWHLDGRSMDNGWDESYRLEDHNHNFAPRNHFFNDEKLPAIEPGTDFYTTTAIADYLLRSLQNHQATYAGTPFLGYLAFTVPHFPLQALQSDIDRYRDRYLMGWDEVRNRRWSWQRREGLLDCDLADPDPGVFPKWNVKAEDIPTQLGPGEVQTYQPWDTLNEAQRHYLADKMAIHAAMVTRMDTEIGRVVEQLKAMGEFDNTVIVFASDNGASAEQMIRGDGNDLNAPPGSAETFLCLGPGWSTACNTPFRLHKVWTHEGGIASPLIVHWPEGIPDPGGVRSDPCHLMDLPPTMLDLAGAAWEDGPGAAPRPSRSLVPAVRGTGRVGHEVLWWSHETNRALRFGDWKIVSHDKGPWELYNLAEDRAEKHDRAGDEPHRVERMAAIWTDRAEDYVADG